MSTKTSAQAGRRTPLSLSGAVAKSQSTKVSTTIANGGGNNANGHATSSSNKQDNKLPQQKNDKPAICNAETKESPGKKQHPQTDKKQHQSENKKSNEKNQNGVNSNKQESSENKYQHQNKEKTAQLGGNDKNTMNEKDKKEKSENIDKLDKPKEKIEKDDTKSKEDKKMEPNMSNNKKEEKKSKDLKDSKEDKKEGPTKSDEKTEPLQPTKCDDKKSKDEGHVEIVDKKSQEKIGNREIAEEEQQLQQKSASTSATPKSNSKANKTSTPVSKTPTKIIEKTPQKSTQTTVAKTTPVVKREVTTTVDDEDTEMEPLAIEGSPIKPSQPEEVTNIKITPSATSTPGKIVFPKRNLAAPKSDVQLSMQTEISPERPKIFSQISGRRSIRPISEYTPSKFQSNLQFRESYRRINTELDVTNTSMNVTVGSEVPSNLSFSFFGRGRKRDRTPPQHSQLAFGELQTDMEISPPKKARLDIQGLFCVVSSPLSLLRNRFSKASLQSSTPVKFVQKLNTVEDEVEVQNVSGVSIHEELATPDKEPSEKNKTNDASLGEEAEEAKFKTDVTIQRVDSEERNIKEFSFENTCGGEQTFEQPDIKITETVLPCFAGETTVKNKRCAVM